MDYKPSQISNYSDSCPNKRHFSEKYCSRDASSRAETFDGLNGVSPSDASGVDNGPLGNTAKSVSHFTPEMAEDRDFRADQFRWQRHASGLLCGTSRIGLCRFAMVSRGAGVSVITTRQARDENAADKAHFRGLQTCGSVWLCPFCGARISKQRQQELNDLLSWSRQSGFFVQMVTLTARHGRKDLLPDLLDGMKRAKQGFARHRSYRNLKGQIVGHVTATEVTEGRNGWHPHYHVLFITDGKVDLEALREPWLASLRGAGLDGGGAAFHVQDATAAGNYVAKFGAAEEIALQGQKQGRSGSRTPQQLLADSCDNGDTRAGRLWVEYAKAFHGRRQIVWSPGLKARVGIGEVSDEKVAEDQAQEEQIEVGKLTIHAEAWQPTDKKRRGVQYFRAEVLRAAESGGFEAVSGLVTDVLSGTGAALARKDLQ